MKKKFFAESRFLLKQGGGETLGDTVGAAIDKATGAGAERSPVREPEGPLVRQPEAPAPLDAETLARIHAGEEAGAEAQRNASVDRLATRTEIDLSKLSDDVKRNIQLSVDLKGVEVQQSFGDKIDVQSSKIFLVGKIREKVGASTISVAKSLLEKVDAKYAEMKDSEVQDFVVDMMASAAVLKAEALFKPNAQYARMEEYLKEKRAGYDFVGYKYVYGSANQLQIELVSGPGNLKEAYEKWVADPANKPAEGAEVVASAVDEEKAKKSAELLKKSAFGRALNFLGIGALLGPWLGLEVDAKGQLTDSAFLSIAKGEGGLLSGIVRRFGGKELVQGNGDEVGEFMAQLNPQHQSVVEGMMGKFPKFLRLEGAAEKLTGVAAVAAAAFTPFSAPNFGKLLEGVEGVEAPASGFSLSNAFSSFVTGKGPEIKLGTGAQMILPEGASIAFWDGTKRVVETALRGQGDKIFSGSTLKILDQIPKGTSFKGPIDFGLFELPA